MISVSTIRSIWSSGGSDKVRASQTIRMLLNSLIRTSKELREDGKDRVGLYHAIKTTVKEVFQPDPDANFNEQLYSFMGVLGWKNALLTIMSSDTAKLVLGNNRYIDEVQNDLKDIELLVNAIISGACYHLFGKEIMTETKIDNLSGVTYEIMIKVGAEQVVKEKPEEVEGPTPGTGVGEVTGEADLETLKTHIEIDQIFDPIFNTSLDKDQLIVMFKEILVEYIRSKYGELPKVQKVADTSDLVLLLLQYLINKVEEDNSGFLEVGKTVGTFFARGIKDVFNRPIEQILIDEIIEGINFGIVRDINARCFCFLSPGDKCTPLNTQICDFVMGVWEGTLSALLEREIKFSQRLPAGRKDRFCLMEFNTS